MEHNIEKKEDWVMPDNSVFRTRLPRNANTFWHMLVVILFLAASLLISVLLPLIT